MNSPRFVRFSQPHYLQRIGRERVTQILLPVANELLPHGIALPATALPDELFFQVLATLPRRAAECSLRLLEAMTAIEVIDEVFPDERTPLVVSELRLRVRVKSRPVLLSPASQHGVLDLEVCGGWESGRSEAVERVLEVNAKCGTRNAEYGLANAEEGTEVRRSQTAATNEEVERSAKGETRKSEILKTETEPLGEKVARFGLRRELGSWSLRFEGRAAVLRDCRAVELVANLLKQPPDQAIHAAEWECRVDGCPLLDGFRGIGRAEDEGRGAIEVGELGGLIEERTGKDFMGRISLPALKAKLAELRAIREDATLPEEERQAAAAELTDLLRAHGRGGKVTGEASRAVDRVRKQIKTLIRELQGAELSRGEGNEVLRGFGRHLEEYLWLPSVGGRKRLGAAGKAGCFTYEPPAGVRWRD